MTLTEKWETCPTCDGKGRMWIGGSDEPCHADCVDGLVPPEGMIEAAAEAMALEANIGSFATPRYLTLARAALLAAAEAEAP